MGKAAAKRYNAECAGELIDEACTEIENLARALPKQQFSSWDQANVARCISRRLIALANAVDLLLLDPESSDTEQEVVIRG